MAKKTSFNNQASIIHTALSQNISNIPSSPFKGPAEYFPQEALKCCRCAMGFLGDRHIEMVYATLAAWNMNSRSAKMPDFDGFKFSILRNKITLYKLKDIRIEDVKKIELNSIIDELQELVFGDNGIDASETNSKCVSGSKVLANILPDLVPPMDGQHTSKFFNHTPGKTLFETVMRTLWSIYQDKKVRDNALIYNKNNPFVTLPKIFDNVIIDYINKTASHTQVVATTHP